MSTDWTAHQQQLAEDYRALDEVPRQIVQTFALLYEPASIANARKCWMESLDQRGKSGSLTIPQFSAQVRKLIASGFLVKAASRTSAGTQCAPLLLEIVVRDTVSQGSFEAITEAITEILPVPVRYHKGPRAFTEDTFTRELRIATYREDLDAINGLLAEVQFAFWRPSIDFYEMFRKILTSPFEENWMNQLSKEFFELGLTLVLEYSAANAAPADGAFDLLADSYEKGEVGERLCLLYAEQLWLRGALDEAGEAIAQLSTKEHQDELSAMQGALALLTGKLSESLSHYRKGLKAVGKSQEAQAAWFDHPASVLFFFALLQEGSPTAYAEAEKYALLLQRHPGYWLQAIMQSVLALLKRQQGRVSMATAAAKAFEKQDDLGMTGPPALLEAFSLYWLDAPNLEGWLPEALSELCAAAIRSGYGWIALEAAELLVVYQPDSPYQEIIEGLRDQADSLPLIGIVKRQETWELSLAALSSLAAPEKKSRARTVSQPEFRLVWRLRFYSMTHWTIAPIEQKISAKGGWTKGKAIALKRLHKKAQRPKYFTDQDHSICSTLEAEYGDNSYYYSRTPSYIFSKKALLELIGHPLVFWEDATTVRVDIVGGEPELIVKRLKGDRLRIALSPPLTNQDILVAKETPTRIKVISVKEDHRRIAGVLGPKNSLEVPARAEERVLGAIASISSLVTIQSDIGGGVEAEEVPADAKPHVHLLPAGSGLKVSLLTRPFGESGSYYRPGEGGATVISEIDGKRVQTQRDLKEEKRKAKAVSVACLVLQEYEQENGEWIIDEASSCLELLLQLKSLEDEITLEWPEGEKFKVSRELGFGDFRMNIRQQQDWFAASGEVQVSEDQVMDLRQLMTLLSNASGQFIPLADGEFLALTDEFRQRLESLQRLAQPHGGKELRINGLAALAMEDMLDDVEQLEIDQAWQDHIQHIKAAREIEPEVPKTLKANLRDYQVEGYTWLARLANWGVGACLADDMGLGKTLQGLAVILDRSSEGPTLVVAPTSVCANWASEAERFAPSLKVQSLGDGDRADRQQLVDGLGAQDMLVCSYGLIQQEDVAEMLSKLSWQTIVLDEAQAIKNHATKRSQAVMSLQGNFKIAMTGTPVENHLGELWNLFRFINPGLLGSLENFNLSFANPVERDKDEFARDALRRLIQPFILRRTKDQVLKELPSRTEITLPVELSKEEMAFYEALRREAVENLSKKQDVQAGQRHLQVLAEIMKLRRACCNPSLVKPELAIPSTKLQQFSDLIEELLDNGHKALVFSQFVGHLKILRKHLDEKEISYQYLDGSTPAKKRKQGVDAFQKGEGDVFLISLKAGGTGLNLTAADYVLHMDPWWNPAVEDQASDRAHRIGQQRPVTIYRLVAKGTIEDKIVALHKVKRDLADSLLTGTDMSSKVSTDELLSLIQQ